MTYPQGIDISAHQTTTPDLSGYDFVWIKADEGTYNDPMWAIHVANVQRAGKLLCAYEFGVNGLTGAEQAALFLARVGNLTKVVALDVEGPTQPTVQQAKDWIAACKAAGKIAGIYHSESGFPDVGEDFRWVAYWYPSEPPMAWTFWQNHGGPLDHNVFHGTLAQLYSFAGVPLPDTSTGAIMGLTVHLDATVDANAPWTAFGTAVNTSGTAAKRVADATSVPLIKGQNMGVVTKATLVEANGTWTAGAPIYLTNIDGHECAVWAPDVTFTPITDPAMAQNAVLQAQLNAAQAKITDLNGQLGTASASLQLTQTKLAAEQKKIADWIAADQELRS